MRLTILIMATITSCHARSIIWTSTNTVYRHSQCSMAFSASCACDRKGNCALLETSTKMCVRISQKQAVGGRLPQYAPIACDLDLWPFDLESGARVTCDVGYLCANFSLPRPFCSWLRPDVHDRQTDVRQHHRLMPRLGGGGITKL